MDITAIRTAFHRDGFVLIESFFDEIYMFRLEHAVRRYIDEVVPGLPPGRVYYESAEGGVIKSMNRLEQFDPFFADFKTQEPYLELVAGIFAVEPREMIAESLQFFGKAACSGSETPWHQDNGFQHYAPAESLMIWLALDNVDEENGCVVFARGSHALGTVEHVASGVPGFSQTVRSAPDLQRFPEVNSVIKRGGVSLHHCNTMHRSGANHSDRPRRALAVNFRTVAAQPDPEARARVNTEVSRLVELSKMSGGDRHGGNQREES